MKINNENNIWGIAAGDSNRDYHEIFLDWNVMLMGPGDPGNWNDKKDIYKEDSTITTRKFNMIKDFCENAHNGDIVFLSLKSKPGSYKVGIIDGDYEWHDIFGDIDGWNLQHTRRVRWLPEEYKPPIDIHRGTFYKINAPRVRQWLANLNIPEDIYNTKLKTIPSDNEFSKLSLEKISEGLFDRGVASNSIESLMHDMNGLIRVANWYERSDIYPSEAETKAYLVIPLLRALGWTQQRMAIEWENIDVALFSGPERKDDALSIIVEVKRKGDSCLSAEIQAANYANKKGRENCKMIIVTDGLRYGIFRKNKEGFKKLCAYMNLTRLVDKYPIYKCEGATTLLSLIAPG